MAIPTSQPLPGLEDTYSASEATPDHLLFKGGRIYQHNVLRINYTTYDVRRSQDIFNPRTDHCDIMMLATAEEWEAEHPGHRFCYARILGIYHANVQYIGPGMKDYLPRRLDFLHVRWLEWIPSSLGNGEVDLDALRFVPMNNVDAFDFIDPADILRGCHLIPAFAKGKLHPDNTSASLIAQDSEDWKCYYINRYDATPNWCHFLFILNITKVCGSRYAAQISLGPRRRSYILSYSGQFVGQPQVG
jgi:hypothetical protein